MIRLAVEVAVSLDRAVILPGSLSQFYADPVTRSKCGFSLKTNDCRSTIVELDCLADLVGLDSHGEAYHTLSAFSSLTLNSVLDRLRRIAMMYKM